nr:aspartic proteinase cdr1 [Quercus suber]
MVAFDDCEGIERIKTTPVVWNRVSAEMVVEVDGYGGGEDEGSSGFRSALIEGDGLSSGLIRSTEAGIFPLLFSKEHDMMPLIYMGQTRTPGASSEASASNVGNMIIDSGTTYTFLPPEFHKDLVSALLKTIHAKRVKCGVVIVCPIPQHPNIKDPKGVLSPCFRSKGDLDIPIITAHFTDADVKLKLINTFARMNDVLVCFTMIPSPDNLAIFGNLAEINFLVRSIVSWLVKAEFWCFRVMEKLMGSWEKFSLSESEGNKFTIQEESRVRDFLLAAKFHTRRVLNMEAIAKTFKLLWRTRKGFEIRDMGDHMVLFRFPEATDIDRVLQGEPWMFDKHLVALKRMETSEAIRGLDFSRTSFWVQVHDLPIRSSTMGIAKE